MRRSERGANVVEMAIVAPILLLLLAGILDLGRLMHDYIIISNASREGARIASRLPCYVDNGTQRGQARNAILAATIAEAANSGVVLEASNITITPDPAASCAGAGNPITVLVTYQFDSVLSGITGIGSITIPAATTMISFGNDQLDG
jgi:Flp pilus assembly protein TadG